MIWAIRIADRGVRDAARQMLDALVSAYPAPIPKQRLGERFGIAPRTLSNYLTMLRTLSLAVDDGQTGMRASDALFPAGAPR